MTLRRPKCHDDFVNFRIKRLLALGGAPAVRICEGEFGVARLEWRVTAALVEHGPAHPTELARRLRLEQARASRTLTLLAAKGLIARERDARDARRALVRATAKGEQLYAQLFPRLARVNERLVSVLDDAELAVFERCVAKLTAHAQHVLDEGTASPKADRRRGGSRRVWRDAQHRLVAPAG